MTTVRLDHLRSGYRIESRYLIIAFWRYVLRVVSMFFFRYVPCALWLAMDCQFDQSLFADPPPEEPHARP